MTGPTPRHRKPRRWLRRIGWAALALFVLGNAFAFRHAWAMTHFAADGIRTPAPEDLSLTSRLWVLIWGVCLPRPENHENPARLGLPFEVLLIPSEGGVTLETWRVPCEKPRLKVLVFHGYGGSKDGMLWAAREFHEAGHEVWLTDFRGAGGSTGATTSLGWHEAADVAAVFREAEQRGESAPIVLHGVSMGAVAILRAAHAERLQPAAIIAECPFNRMLDTVKNRFRLMRLPPLPAAHALVFWGGIQQGFNAFALNSEDFASAVTCPTLVLLGADDWRVTRPQAERVRTRLAGPSRFQVFENSGHAIYTAATATQWRQTVGAFLSDFALR